MCRKNSVIAKSSILLLTKTVCNLKTAMICTTCEVDFHVNALLIIIHCKSMEQKGETENILRGDSTFFGCNSQVGFNYYIKIVDSIVRIHNEFF